MGWDMPPTPLLFPRPGGPTPDAGGAAGAAWPELADLAAQLVGEDPFPGAAESTALAQPATFVASMAAWREREPDLRDGVCAMAGHSLGELSALAAAGALTVPD